MASCLGRQGLNTITAAVLSFSSIRQVVPTFIPSMSRAKFGRHPLTLHKKKQRNRHADRRTNSALYTIYLLFIQFVIVPCYICVLYCVSGK